jgi:hypothetical protein
MISGVGDGDGVDWRARMSSMTLGLTNCKLIVDVGAGDDADSESPAVRMPVDVDACDGADSELPVVRMPVKLTVGVGDDNGDDDDDNWRAIRIAPTS